VVCEKPLATSLADTQALIDTARQQGVFLMEAMWMRFLPTIVEVKRRIDAGDIGAIRFMQGSFSYPDVRRDHGSYASAAHAMLYDRGVYLIALAHLLVGGDVTKARAQGQQWAGHSLCRFDAQMSGGAWLSGVCGNAGELSNRFEIIGERGSISLASPFFKPHGFVIQPLSSANQQAAASLSSSDTSSAAWMASAKQFKRRFQWLLEAARGARQPQLNFKGNGYQFEFMQAGQCIAAGQQQCQRMTWADSMTLAHGLQTVADAMEWTQAS
jgi:predicted dehydrogenase